MPNWARHWTSGESLNHVSAEFMNYLVDVVRDYLRRKGAKPGQVIIPPKTEVYIKNVSATHLRQFAIVQIGTALVEPDEDEETFFGKSVFKSAAPADDKPFVILQEPCPKAGGIVRAIVTGNTFASVQMQAAAHEFAAAIDGDYDKLKSQSAQGPAGIIWHQEPDDWDAATGYNVGDTAKRAGIYYTCILKSTNNQPPNGTYWSVGAICWALVVVGRGAAGNVGLSTIIADTSASFVIPAVAGTVAVSITSAVDTSIWMLVGQTVEINDGTRRIYGWISAIAGAQDFTFTLTRVAAGAAGQTMLADASVIISGDPSAITSINGGATGAQLITSTGGTVTITQPNAATTNLEVANPGIDTINGDGTAAQVFTVGTSGTDFGITDTGAGTLQWDLPDASATARGAVTTASQTFAGVKTFNAGIINKGDYVQDDGVVGLTISIINSTPDNLTMIFSEDPTNALADKVRLIFQPAGGAFTNGLLILSAMTGGVADTAVSFAIHNGAAYLAGVWGTDPVGNVVSGGIITTLGTGSTTGTNTGDQLVFKTIAVSGQSDVVADTITDTLTLAAGTGITLTTNAGTDTITITATATSPADGVNTKVTAGSVAALTETISVSLSSNQNDYNPSGFAVTAPTTSRVRINCTSVSTLTGLVAGADGQIVTLQNVGSNAITLSDEDAASSAANRFSIDTIGTTGIVLLTDHCAVLQYDGTSSRWRHVAGSGTYKLAASQLLGNPTGSAATVTGIGIDSTLQFVSSTTLGVLQSGLTATRTEGTLAATGSVQGDAAAIVTDAVGVTGADATKGVILPNTAAKIVVVHNTDGSNMLKVYPNSGAQISGNGTNNAQTQIASSVNAYFRISSTQWFYSALT